MKSAEVAELGDATALGAVGSNPVGVQISPSALYSTLLNNTSYARLFIS